MKTLTLLVVLIMLYGCGGSSGGGSSVSPVATTDQLTMNYYNNSVSGERIYYEVLNTGYLRVHYAKDNKRYYIEGYYRIVNNVMTIDPVVDSCNKGKQVVPFSRYNQQIVYINNIEFVDTATPVEQWTFFNYERKCY